MTQAFISLAAERIEPGPLRWVGGVLQQETRLYMGEQCVCVLLVSFPPGSPEWLKGQRSPVSDGGRGLKPELRELSAAHEGSPVSDGGRGLKPVRPDRPAAA